MSYGAYAVPAIQPAQLEELQRGVNRMVERVQRIGEAAGVAAEAVGRMIDQLPAVEPDVRCDHSGLWESQCGHCSGHPEYSERRHFSAKDD